MRGRGGHGGAGRMTQSLRSPAGGAAHRAAHAQRQGAGGAQWRSDTA